MIRLSASGATVAVDGGKHILIDASIDIHAGEVHALVGPNGAGKSTLFGVLAGDVATEAGTVMLDGTSLRDIPHRDLARHRAVLLQSNTVSFPFTVEQVVRMGRAPWARTPASGADDEIVTDALLETDTAHLTHRSFPSLSGGERARVALARVLAQATDIVMLDEPTAALDLKHQEDVLRVVRRRADLGTAVAVVLHDLNAAMAYADRVTLLSRGTVMATGTAADVLTAERIEDVYGHPVDVFAHPVTGEPVVMPRRARR